MVLQKISVIISLLLIFQNQNSSYDLRNSGPVSELYCKNSFNGLRWYTVMIINCWARLQRLLLLITQMERGQYLPRVIMLFGPEYCDISYGF